MKPVAMVSIAARVPCRCAFHPGTSNLAEPRTSVAHLRRTVEKAQQGPVRAPGASFRSRRSRTQTLVAESQSGTVATTSEEAAWRRRQVRVGTPSQHHVWSSGTRSNNKAFLVYFQGFLVRSEQACS